MKSLAARETPREWQAPQHAASPPSPPLEGGGGGGFSGFADPTGFASSGTAALYCACDLCRTRQLALDNFDNAYACSYSP